MDDLMKEKYQKKKKVDLYVFVNSQKIIKISKQFVEVYVS